MKDGIPATRKYRESWTCGLDVATTLGQPCSLLYLLDSAWGPDEEIALTKPPPLEKMVAKLEAMEVKYDPMGPKLAMGRRESPISVLTPLSSSDLSGGSSPAQF